MASSKKLKKLDLSNSSKIIFGLNFAIVGPKSQISLKTLICLGKITAHNCVISKMMWRYFFLIAKCSPSIVLAQENASLMRYHWFIRSKKIIKNKKDGKIRNLL